VINVAAILCPTDASTFEELGVSAKDLLLDAILANPSHVLHQLFALISVAFQSYMLRPRAHNRQITPSHLCNFINRMLYKNS